MLPETATGTTIVEQKIYQPSPSTRVREQVALYEATDGREGGTLEDRPVVILTTVGARTGNVRKNPVMRIEHAGTYLAVASNGGAITHPAWYRNLRAHPEVRLQDGATLHRLVAREVFGAEKARWWQIAEQHWPHFPEISGQGGRPRNPRHAAGAHGQHHRRTHGPSSQGPWPRSERSEELMSMTTTSSTKRTNATTTDPSAASEITAKSEPKRSPRERLLAAANELFYAKGVQTVGIDRVIEHAGVAKASLYSTFGSKEGLVRAYLESRHAGTMGRLTRAIERHTAPRARLLAVFDAQGELFAEPDFRGCAFVAASAEAPHGGLVEQAADGYRGWIRTLLTELAEEAGAADPPTLARQLQLVYDGAGLSARMDRDPSIAVVSRAAAEALLDAAL